ncbi:thioredoxin family protein [Litorilituus sediminis]|uniref:Thioredoxin family protein n=1 Tax=Litorilituus sediminis TaxID=718192 RepID=A0A4P6P3Z4_9GAMM|nr:thioredoxin family protein [Litorilituus sediminis]QBG36171.1 thioredoxin family protein [Litorilituus sediminis]
MKFLIAGLLSILLLLSQQANSATSTSIDKLPLADLPEYSKVYDDTRDPFQDARDALALAQQTNRQVLIEIGGNWCTWCHKVDNFLANNPDIYQTLHENYVLLKVNVSDSNENEAFMSGLPPVLGYPHMYISTAQGKMLLSKDTAELLSGDNYSRSNWLAFLDKWSLKQQNTSKQLSNNTQQSTEE